eukprot:TRINITY_DN44672_c0_g1_i2.p1 TRINITY_DN44672_c0_g1~~TRINITY_DN44672_c0_g1_i2.p1  ORF type:complete len:402 (-),score=104.91 TRINITY_DN44672_c0_g1_i2:235-1440(-)
MCIRDRSTGAGAKHAMAPKKTVFTKNRFEKNANLSREERDAQVVELKIAQKASMAAKVKSRAISARRSELNDETERATRQIQEINAVCAKLRTKGRKEEAAEAQLEGSRLEARLLEIAQELEGLENGVFPGEAAPAKPTSSGPEVHVWREFEFGGLKTGLWILPIPDEDGDALDHRLAAVLEYHDALIKAAPAECAEHDGDLTGQMLWHGSNVLCKYLDTSHGRNAVKRRRVVELGAGAGLCGLIAAEAGAESVVLTDGNTLAVNLAERNVKGNEKVRATRLDWGAGPHLDAYIAEYGQCDVLMGTDSTYDLTFIEPLFQTARALLQGSDGVLFLGFICRGTLDVLENLAAAAAANGMVLTDDEKFIALSDRLCEESRVDLHTYAPKFQCYKVVPACEEEV